MLLAAGLVLSGCGSDSTPETAPVPLEIPTVTLVDAGDGAADDGYGDAVPDDEPIQVPEGRLTVRDIMLRLEWEKREALGPGSPDPDSGTADNR